MSRDRGGGPGGIGNSDSGGKGRFEGSFHGHGAASATKWGKWNKADSAGDVPSPARKWNNRNMDAKVQRTMRTAGRVIGSSKMVGTSKCVYHLRLKGLLHDLVHGSV